MNSRYLQGYSPGNLSGEIPISNGILNQNLNADKLNGKNSTDFYLRTELQTDGQSSVHWNNLTNVPSDIADGDDVGDLNLPYSGEVSHVGNAFSVTNTGGGTAGKFAINGSGLGSNSLFAYTNGTGKAGYFQIANASSNSPALYSKTNGNGPGIKGECFGSGVGVEGASSSSNGILGYTSAANESGVRGETGASGAAGVSGGNDRIDGKGVAGWSTAGKGVYGWSETGTAGYFDSKKDAVHGVVSATGSSFYTGFYGDVSGGSGFNYGVYGSATYSSGNNYGVRGHAYSSSGENYGVYGYAGGSATNWAGFFSGDVRVTGSIYKGGGMFMIDHPIDPENKYLSHSSVESPDMKNVYDGVAVLNAQGEAVVELPNYFEALNRDYRYQLTCIGGFAPAYISEEIYDNRFKIAGGGPGMRVSWQVTGIRKDAFAEANPIQVETEKLAKERGKYLHPEAFGFGEEHGIYYEERKAMTKGIGSK